MNGVMPGSAEDLGDLKKSGSWVSDLDGASWFLGLAEARLVLVYGMPMRW